MCFDFSENDVTGGNPTHNSDTDIFQHQIQLWSIFRGIIAKMVQYIADLGSRPTNSHKLDFSRGGPFLGLRLGNLIRGFRLQFHIMENSLDADNILFNIASGSHNPVLENKTEKVSNQNRQL